MKDHLSKSIRSLLAARNLAKDDPKTWDKIDNVITAALDLYEDVTGREFVL